MKIGFSIAGVAAQDYVAVAQTADNLGYDLLMVSDHLVVPRVIPSNYPYTEDGTPPFDRSTPWLDPLVSLGFVASATKRILLGTNILILPLRDPTLVAKQVATLDQLSNGRLLLGVGTGWMQAEFDTVGLAYENKGRRTVEMIEVMKRLWTDPMVEFKGEFYSVGPFVFEPKPVQRPGPRLHFGGEGSINRRRAARLTDGLLGMQHTPESASDLVKEMAAMRREFGREREPFEITVQCAVPPTIENMRRYEDSGVDRVSVRPWERRPGLTGVEVIAGLERFASEVMAKLS